MCPNLITKAGFRKYFIPLKKDDIIREFIDNILDCVIFISKNHYIKWVNREALNMLGYEEEALRGKKFSHLLGGNFASRWDDFCTLMQDVPVRNQDIVLKSRAGSEIHVKMSIMPYSDNTGATEGWLLMAKDMTEPYNIIKELMNSQRRLQHAIKELEHSRDELIHNEKLSFAGRIAASVAHEIRNPLNIIGMAIQQLHSELREKDAHREYTKMIMEHINRVNKLLTEFVDVTRPPKLKLREEDMNPILDEVLKLAQPKIQERKAKVIKMLDRNLPKIRIDRDHMLQALTNLILNSCDALPKRGGKIWLSLKREGNFIVIKLRNTGRPIPKKDLIRIGEPYFSTKKKGTGLGTSIVYSIIGSHGGTISVESNRNIGTIFTISLSL